MGLRAALLLLGSVGLFAAGLGAGSAPATTPGGDARAEAYEAHVAALFREACTDCHAGAEPEAGLDLERLALAAPSEDALLDDEVLWSKVAAFLEGGAMPPEGMPPLAPARVESAVGWVTSALETARDAVPADPGRVTIRRLNRTEYRNTVRDLLGVDVDVTALLPRDEVGYGFDHIGDVLALPPALLEKYLDAAEHVAERAIVVADPRSPVRYRIPGASLRSDRRTRAVGSARLLTSNGRLFADLWFPVTGTYRLRARAYGHQAGPEPARLRFHVGKRRLDVVDVTAEAAAPEDHEIRVRVEGPAERRVSVVFTNDYYRPEDPDPTQRDRNLVVVSLAVDGPLPGTIGPLPESHARLVTAVPRADEEPASVAARVLRKVVRRAFRRPAQADEVRRLAALVDEVVAAGEPFERGLQVALQAILVSPHFLFRVELDAGAAGAAVEPIAEHALASRLSYFLWSSMPDERLLAAADAGTLRRDLDLHVARMLADEKASALATNFGAQWLQLPRLAESSPDGKRFPRFDAPLRRSMRLETERLLLDVFLGDRSILALLVPDAAWLDARLARHYGAESALRAVDRAADADGFRPVPAELVPGRGGLLGHAGILTLTSYPTRTSPVIRGKYVLEQLLATPPPPPPPGVGALEDQTAAEKQLSLRDRLEIHRADPSCAVCHARMDTIGFGLETFDAIGAPRAGPVESGGTLPDGRRFSGPAELAVLIAEDPAFPRAFASNLMTFALARGLERGDRKALDEVVASAQREGYRFSAFVKAIVRSSPFLERRAVSGDAP